MIQLGKKFGTQNELYFSSVSDMNTFLSSEPAERESYYDKKYAAVENPSPLADDYDVYQITKV